MAQQKSESRVVPEGRRKSPPTSKVPGGGKAVPVKGVERQLLLPLATAENSRFFKREPTHRSNADLSVKRRRVEPKASGKRKSAVPARMEEVVERLAEAFNKVAANKGAPGPDGLTIGKVRQHLPRVLAKLNRSLMEGTYEPGNTRRVWIPKAGGGQRGLGIPNVVDRMVQEAIRLVLEPVYEPTFHPSNHGFRSGRGCQTAIAEARSYVEEGYQTVVDIDLAKFFDRVHHQRLMARLAQQVSDKRLLRLIGKMLKAKVIMPDGVKVATAEGVPQGGPLSPLLSNIVLSELDWELAQRGHRFVRYADDCNIYVRSERAGQRVMASVSRFIERRLRLSVNQDKSAVASPANRHFLGYRLVPQEDGSVEIGLSERSIKRLRQRARELTPRSAGRSLQATIASINRYLKGWLGHFRVCTSIVEQEVSKVDARIRRRLRALILKQWKRRRTMVRRLIRLGTKRKTAWKYVYEGRKSIWALSHTSAVHRGLRNTFFVAAGLLALKQEFSTIWAPIPAPAQLGLTLEPARS